ncbi:MAG: class B sortase [Clostridium sp.]|nr:class B sortase [Clostridium sp.]
MENKRKSKIIKGLFLVGFIVCLIPIGRAYYLSMQHKAQQRGLKEIIEESEKYTLESDGKPEETAASGSDMEESAEEAAPVILSKYAELYEENHDLAGWLSIEGMKIDYPVMQCEDDEYYLYHDFYKKDNIYGSLYVRERADLGAGTNFIIYGHNMRDGSMFGDLDMYLEESFYLEHPLISFDTLYEERMYEIIAVFRSQVYNVEDDVFKYYQFYEAETEEEFNDFYENIKMLSLYDTGVEAEFGDTFLTLSTCAYHVEDGRLVVVARRRSTEE